MSDSQPGTQTEKFALAGRALFRYRRSHDYWSPSVHAFWYWHAQQVLELVHDAFAATGAPNSLGVDIGCGDGFLARKIADRFPFFQFVGMELDRDTARIIDAENEFAPSAKKVLPVVGNVYAIPLLTGAADLAICSEVVEHLTDDARALHELHRILKPGGLLILATPNAQPLPHRLVWALRGKRSAGNDPVPPGAPDSQSHGHINVQSAAYWREALRHAGFSVEACLPVTPLYGREDLDRSPFVSALVMLLQAATRRFSWGHHFSEGLVISARKPRTPS
jgi:SAM-dependent methyltransferase